MSGWSNRRARGGEVPGESLDEASVGVTKAACTQAMHERAPRDLPVSTTVRFAILKPPIRGAPAVLKPYLIAKQDEIKRDTEYNALAAVEADGNAAPRAIRHLPARAEPLQDSINHRGETGRDDVSSGTRNTGRSVRQVKQPPQSGSRELKPIDRRSRVWDERDELWRQALAVGVPRAAPHRQPTGVILSLMKAFQKQDIAPSPATASPQSPPRDLPTFLFLRERN